MFVAANSEYEMHIAATGTSYEEIVGGKAGYIRLVEFSDSVLPKNEGLNVCISKNKFYLCTSFK